MEDAARRLSEVEKRSLHFEIWSEKEKGKESVLDQALKKWLERSVPAMVGARKQASA